MKPIYPLLFLALCAHAADPPRKEEPFSIKTRSSFDFQGTPRSPFWPVGWAKREAATATPTPAPKVLTVPPAAMRVSSISLEPRRMAVVNGKICEEGDEIKVLVEGTLVKLTVFHIEDGKVIFNFQGQEIHVGIKVR